MGPALVLPFLAALFYFVIFDDAWISRVFYIGIKVFLVVWPLAVYRFCLSHRWWSIFKKGNLWHAILWGTGSGVVIGVIIYGIMLTPLGKIVENTSGVIRERADHLGVLRHYWLFSVFLSVIHSFIEEYYWRWFVYGSLRRIYSQSFAIIVASLGFAAHHVIITGQLMNWWLGALCGVCIGIGGGFWAWLYSRTGRLIVPWISHAIVDFTVMAIGYYLIKNFS